MVEILVYVLSLSERRLSFKRTRASPVEHFEFHDSDDTESKGLWRDPGMMIKLCL